MPIYSPAASTQRHANIANALLMFPPDALPATYGIALLVERLSTANNEIKFRQVRGGDRALRHSFCFEDAGWASRSAASIFVRTRRAARAANRVCVRPDLSSSPRRNCHSQTSASAVASTVYSTPL